MNVSRNNKTDAHMWFQCIEKQKEGAGACAPAIHMKKIVCIGSETSHYLLGGTLPIKISKVT